MRIIAFALDGISGRPALGTDALAPGLNVFYGPPASGKTTLADLMAQALYGRRFVAEPASEGPAAPVFAPQGETVVENRGRQYRLRRLHDDAAGERLTVAALDHSAVDRDSVRQLVARLPPSILQPLFAVSFRETPQLDWLLSPEFSQEFRAALWRLKWAPPAVQAELRPIYGRMRALETQVATLAHRIDSEEARAAAAAKANARLRKRRASHFLARLTDGELLRLRLAGRGGEPRVITSAGDSLDVGALWSTQRDQVYLSVCLALVAALGRGGVRLPLVLDEPFARLDARSGAALVRVLGEFSRRGQQVVVFTANREAAERAAQQGTMVQQMERLYEPRLLDAKPQAAEPDRRPIRRRVRRRPGERREAG